MDTLADYNYFMDTQRLRIAVSNMKNANVPEELERICTLVLQNLSQMPAAPSAQFTQQPAPHKKPEMPEEDPDVRGGGQAYEDKRRWVARQAGVHACCLGILMRQLVK